jgi:hypothetical protein
MIKVISNRVQVSSQPDIFVLMTPMRIRITGIIKDAGMSLAVKEGLIGIVVRTFIEGGDIGIPGARVAFAEDTIEAVAAMGRQEVAKALQDLASDPMDCFVFDKDTYELV